jgi:hypothetical protein
LDIRIEEHPKKKREREIDSNEASLTLNIGIEDDLNKK